MLRAASSSGFPPRRERTGSTNAHVGCSRGAGGLSSSPSCHALPLVFGSPASRNRGTRARGPGALRVVMIPRSILPESCFQAPFPPPHHAPADRLLGSVQNRRLKSRVL